ncbi:3-dehydroquinate synthase II [Caldimonas brevitalea]|uniref:3-dehydroquinate synthase n=1 Tax=Caldimonas brevitalea TaxID=413882 RepID=A0A0G3BK30_9BURK|nr:3-dehydroquinate synthase II [Caldimonas brevitalea]AKJ26890.1 3-dehydroquinate synthase [Caldimonas brevitalea]
MEQLLTPHVAAPDDGGVVGQAGVVMGDTAAARGAARSPFTTAVPGTRAAVIWYDSRALTHVCDETRRAIVQRLGQGGYNGIVLYPEGLRELGEAVSPRLQRVIQVDSLALWAQLSEQIAPHATQGRIEAGVVSSGDPRVLVAAKAAGFRTCWRAHVDNAPSLKASCRDGLHYDHLLVSFKDATNIPLEHVIAELHGTRTVLLKEVHENVDDAVIALGVLELGSDGVAVGFTTMAQFDAFARKLERLASPRTELQVGVTDRITHLGLGYRACIDTTHLFNADEGILVGSTSSGGILCCPEVFHLPYMELRPFRINAASVHSYVFQSHNRTSYISELRAGSQLTTVNARGETRQVYVGRVKTEIRPLLLIEATFPQQRKVNIIMQDDWHVRVFSDEAKPRNVTELKPGDPVLGFGTEPGRHVGVKVDEHIIEV